jgi:lipoprotein-anchoring transpeptidase ErfK/SrfK
MRRRTAGIVVGWVIAAAASAPAAPARADDSVCAGLPGAAPGRVSYRADIHARTAVYPRLPTTTRRATRAVSPSDAPWLLVLAPPHAAAGRCWVKVMLPWRPNHASGWIDADTVGIAQTPWRIVVSRRQRTLTLYKSGARAGVVPVVVGKPSTPTPSGLFAITWAIRWHPGDFLGSWVLELTAHSDVLHQFDGGDGTVGIHGRGGASLNDPLGTARSHGCIRLANTAIDWLVRRIGQSRLPATPVQIR